MRNNIFFTVLLALLIPNSIFGKIIPFTIENKTNQMIVKLDYWLGDANQANAAGLNFSSKGAIDKNGKKVIPLDFHKKKRNTLLVKAFLKGGGYVSQKYTINKGEEAPNLSLFNVAEPIPTDEMKKVMERFSKLNLDDGNLKLNLENGINSLIGSIIVYDEGGKIISRIGPKTLKTKVSSIPIPELKQKISGLFSSNTAISGNVSLPIVSTSTSFETGDVAKFVWEIEDVGQYKWSTENNKSLAQLFLAIPQENKDELVLIYEQNPNVTMKFIDEAFVIGRLEVTTYKSKKISSNIELNGANYVTAKGNYMFIDDFKDEMFLKDVVTEVKGYDATNLLKTLYAQEKAKKEATLSNADNSKIITEYNFLRTLYPDFLIETDDVHVMKKALKDLDKNQEEQILFINKTLEKEKINLNEIQFNE